MITEAQRLGMMSSATVEWATPRSLFHMLDREFRFDLDACAANAEMARCDRYISTEDDSLSERWAWRRRVWVNPPYGNGVGDWVEKAYRSARGSAEYCEHVVMLLPARTDTSWFHDYCLKASEIRFLRGRLCFNDERNKRAPFPSMIVVFRSLGPTEARQQPNPAASLGVPE